MLITVISCNSLSLNSSTYETTLLNPFATPSANIGFIEQSETDASDADAYTVNVQTKVLLVKIKDYPGRYARISELKTTFKRGTKCDLLVKFSDDNTNYQMACRVVDLVQDSEHSMYWNVILQTSQTSWRAESLTVVEQAIDGEESIEITVGGNDETRLIAEMEFSSGPGSGYISQMLYQLPNPTWAAGTIPWFIELDTAAIIALGDMLATCNDVRIGINGKDTPRWIIDPNTDHTKIVFNVTLNRGYTFALKTAITDTNEITSIEFNFAADSNRDLDNMPASGILYHGSEWFHYSAFNKSNLIATIDQRGAFGTTPETHAVNDVFTYIQNIVILQFGNSEATDPALDDAHYDDTKPMIDLDESSRLLWVWNTNSGFYDPNHPGRTAQWAPRVGGTEQGYYVVTQSDVSGDLVMGTALRWVTSTPVGSSLYGGAFWSIQFGTQIIESITTTGLKMRDVGVTDSLYYPKSILLLPWGVPDRVVWQEAVPAADGVWHTFSTHEDVVIPEPYNNAVTFQFYGYINAQAGAIGLYAEINGVSIVFDDLFTGLALLEQKSNVTMDVTLVNDTNDDSLGANYPLLANKIISIDSEKSIVTYDSFNYHSAIILNDETRPVFIRLQPGTNTISLKGAIGAGTLRLSWYARRM